MLRPSHVSSALSFFISHCNAQAPSLQFSGQPFFEPFGVPTFVEINQCVGCLSSRRRVAGVKFDFHTGTDREIRELVRVRAVSHWTILREQAGQVRPRQRLCGNATLDSCRR